MVYSTEVGLNDDIRRRAVLLALQPRYERRGYRFIVEPSNEHLPEFLAGYRPDAVALKGDGGVVIEVVSGQKRRSNQQLESLIPLFQNRRAWQLEVVSAAGPDTEGLPIPRSSAELVLSELKSAEELAGAGRQRAALLLAWATLEAATRVLCSEEGDLDRPLSPAQIPEALARYGLIDQKTAAALRNVVVARNAVAHGDLLRTVRPEEVRTVIEVTRGLFAEAAGSA